MDTKWIIGLLAIVGVSLVGCNKPDPNAPLLPQAEPTIPDVPLPLGFDLDEGKSTSREDPGSGIRHADHRFKGNADKFKAQDFYVEQMPSTGWVLITNLFDKGEICMDFEKNKEQCKIILSDGGWFHKTDMRITIGPITRNGPKPASPGKKIR